MSQEKVNFAKDLKHLETEYNTRSQFVFRMNRFKFNNGVRIPYSPVSIRTITGGWLLKGALAYTLFYYTCKRLPISPYLNREGYADSFDKGHHTFKHGKIDTA